MGNDYGRCRNARYRCSSLFGAAVARGSERSDQYRREIVQILRMGPAAFTHRKFSDRVSLTPCRETCSLRNWHCERYPEPARRV